MIVRADAKRPAPFRRHIATTCMTSPPYPGRRKYGHSDDEIGLEALHEYCRNLVAVGDHVAEVLVENGTWWLNIGDYSAGSGGAGGDYNEGGSKEGQLKYRQGRPTIGLPRRSAQGDLFAGPSVDGWSYEHTRLPTGNWGLAPFHVATHLQGAGWFVRKEIVWDKCLTGGTRVYARSIFGEGPLEVRKLFALWEKGIAAELWTGETWTPVRAMREMDGRDRSRELVLRSGEVIGCTADHVWPLADGTMRTTDQLARGNVVATTKLPDPATHCGGLPDEDVGWLVGLYLAEGSRSKSSSLLRFAGHTQEADRHERLTSIAARYHGTMTLRTDGNRASAEIGSKILRAVIDTYVGGSDAKTKGLLRPVWNRSDRFLRALLEGYLEGDGNLEPSGRWRVNFTANDRLAADLRTLAARIGWSCRLRRYVHQSQWGSFPGWRGELRAATSRYPDAAVKEVRPGRGRRFYDISVDSPNVFALGSGVLTHNCDTKPEDPAHTRRPGESHETVFMLTRSMDYKFNPDAIPKRRHENADAIRRLPAGTVGRLIKGSRGHRLKGAGDVWYGEDTKGNPVAETSLDVAYAGGLILAVNESGSVWHIPAGRAAQEGHPAVMPDALAERCIALSTDEGDLVYDPFAGSGTTIDAANRMNRVGFGCDLYAGDW